MYLFPSLHIFVNFSIKRAWHHCGLMPRPISKLLLCEDFGRTRTFANARNFLLVHNPQNLINPRKNPNPNFWGSGSWFHLIKFQVSWVRHQKTREIRVGFRVFSGFCTLYLEHWLQEDTNLTLLVIPTVHSYITPIWKGRKDKGLEKFLTQTNANILPAKTPMLAWPYFWDNFCSKIWRSNESSKISKGSFTNYVDKLLNFHPPLCWQFLP